MRNVDLVVVMNDGLVPAERVEPSPISAAWGETFNIHLILLASTKKQIVSSDLRIVTYGARTKPIPDGRQLFKHEATPTQDGGWDLTIVHSDYSPPYTPGRVLFDMWLTDNTLSPPQFNQIELLPFIVTPLAIAPEL